jgi:galactokinase
VVRWSPYGCRIVSDDDGRLIRAFAPGRVNLIGDHTDYAGGFVLPMAIQLGTTVTVREDRATVTLRSDAEPEPAVVPVDVTDPSEISPQWARFVASVVAEVKPVTGRAGSVRTTLPIGAGLSSSAALEVAVALALGFRGSRLELALACQRAEERASGVPCGVMDQLASAAGVEGHALMIDCSSLTVTPVPVPAECEIVAVHSGSSRSLATTEYAARRGECETAEATIGPLRNATPDDVGSLGDPLIRRRARHVVTENMRVTAFCDALRSGELAGAGVLMAESHASLRDDFEVSTTRLDDLVADLARTPGVYGARLTGAGFGGCAVALTEPGALRIGWRLRASAGAALLPPGAPRSGA